MGSLQDRRKIGAVILLDQFDKLSKTDLEKFMEGHKKGEKDHDELVRCACKEMTNYKPYQDGKTDINYYKICCEMVDYCSFYVQEWRKLGALIKLGEFDKLSKTDLEKLMESHKKGEKDHDELVRFACKEITNYKPYQEGKTDINSYKICCEMVDYCSFYVQTWFYLVCAGVVLLLIIIGIVVSCCLCCKKRGGGGKDVEAIEETTEEEDSKIH